MLEAARGAALLPFFTSSVDLSLRIFSSEENHRPVYVMILPLARVVRWIWLYERSLSTILSSFVIKKPWEIGHTEYLSNSQSFQFERP